VGRAKDFLRQIGKVNVLPWEDFNPDAELDPADLDPWIHFLSRTAWNTVASLWFPEQADGARAARLIYRYLINKQVAMERRLNRVIPAALEAEARCDAIYRQLPDYARW
jgi:hypothetical protein